jgi:hypothetical protein
MTLLVPVLEDEVAPQTTKQDELKQRKDNNVDGVVPKTRWKQKRHNIEKYHCVRTAVLPRENLADNNKLMQAGYPTQCVDDRPDNAAYEYCLFHLSCLIRE